MKQSLTISSVHRSKKADLVFLKKINRRSQLNAYQNGETTKLKNGAVVIAAITSCTNTSNPSVMIGAGLVAKKAVENGLTKPAYVKSH